jgi:hypothetical protein
MADAAKKPVPPYATYQSFSNFINGLREHGIPKHITRSILPGSNSGKASMSATLSVMGLVNEKEEPTALMRQLTDSGNDYKEKLKEILLAHHPFFQDGSIDLSDTTTDKVVDKFKELGASGSTVTKCMAFLLAAAKDADIAVSRYVKTPPPPTRAVKKKSGKPAAAQIEESEEEEEDDRFAGLAEKERIVVSVHGMDDWEIFVPAGLSPAQWKHGLKMAKFILDNYRPSEDGGAAEDL